jgi:hypothetical protein
MTQTTGVFVPTAPSEQKSKPNFNYLVDDVAELLTSKFGVGKVLKRSKRAASIPAPEPMVKELAGLCDLVITGSGD